MLKAFERWLSGPAPALQPKPREPRIDADVLLAAPRAAIAQGRKDDAKLELERLIEVYPELAEAHFLLGKLLHEEKAFVEARDSFLLASCFRPEWAEPHFRLGLLGIEDGRSTDALEALERAVELGAQGARVQNALGAAYMQTGDIPKAVECLERAIALEPDFAPAHSNLGYARFKSLEQYDAGAWHIERALQLAPSDTSVLCNWVMVLAHRGETRDALSLCDRLLAQDPTLPQPRINKSLMLLGNGELASGWQEYEARKQEPSWQYGRDLPYPEWDGSALDGRTIAVYSEQGVGDDIMFASCLPDLVRTAGRSVLVARPKLADLFRRSFPEIEVVTTDAGRESPAIRARAPDFKTAIGSLPLHFRRSRSDFPQRRGYLRADEARVAYWRSRLDALPGSRKVGISWRGGLAATRLSLRSIPLQQWGPILGVPDIDFVSLQYADPDAEVAALRDRTGMHLHQWQEAIDEYDETAALVKALDLVISVQTAIVHLAGALGCPVRALIPHVSEWRYGSAGETMLWYPSVSLIRQPRPGDWASVIESIRDELTAWTAHPVG